LFGLVLLSEYDLHGSEARSILLEDRLSQFNNIECLFGLVLLFDMVCLCTREEQIHGFSDVCDGVEFIELQKLPESQGQYPRPLHMRPALHTFWTECWVSQ
jgi:hypothetical protein